MIMADENIAGYLSVLYREAYFSSVLEWMVYSPSFCIGFFVKVVTHISQLWNLTLSKKY
jgi:hypothetical protein